MIKDYELEFSTAQALTGDEASDHVISLGALKDVGAGEPIRPWFRVDTAFDALTSLDVVIQGCDDAAGTNPVTLVTKNFLLADLDADDTALTYPDLPAGVATKDFIRAFYNVNGANPTVGKISGGFVTGTDSKPANVATVY